MSSLRVAMLLSNGFRPDPRVLKEAESLAEKGFQISIICWDRANEMLQFEVLRAGVEVIRIQSVPSSYGLGLKQLARLLRFWLAAFPILDEIKPDLVHCHDFDTLPAGLWWGKLHRKPVIYDAHEYYADLVKPRLTGVAGKLLYWLIYNVELLGAHLSTAVITVDETLAEIYLRQNDKVEIIGHYPKRSLAQKAAPVFTKPDLRLIYIGRLSSDRGILTYINLIRRLKEVEIPARLILAGVFTPITEEAILRAHIQGLEDAVEFQGWLPYEKIPSLLQSCDIGLSILSPVERYVKALPVKLFEYMACGLPVIASNFPAISGIIGKTSCGALVDPTHDIDDIVQIVLNWWNEPGIARRLGENGRQAILNSYNWEILVNRLENLYRSII